MTVSFVQRMADRPVESLYQVTSFGMFQMGTDIQDLDLDLIERGLTEESVRTVGPEIVQKDGLFLFSFDFIGR